MGQILVFRIIGYLTSALWNQPLIWDFTSKCGHGSIRSNAHYLQLSTIDLDSLVRCFFFFSFSCIDIDIYSIVFIHHHGAYCIGQALFHYMQQTSRSRSWRIDLSIHCLNFSTFILRYHKNYRFFLLLYIIWPCSQCKRSFSFVKPTLFHYRDHNTVPLVALRNRFFGVFTYRSLF